MSTSLARYTVQALEQRGWQPGSTLENQVALLLSNEGFTPGDFVQQFRIGRYRIDFAIPDLRLAIEVDGWYHRMPGKAERDAERDAFLATRGWRTLRISDEGDMSARVAEVSATVREAIATRPAIPPVFARYLQEVDPAGVLQPSERAKRGRSLMRAQLAELQLRAMKRRRRKAA